MYNLDKPKSPAFSLLEDFIKEIGRSVVFSLAFAGLVLFSLTKAFGPNVLYVGLSLIFIFLFVRLRESAFSLAEMQKNPAKYSYFSNKDTLNKKETN